MLRAGRLRERITFQSVSYASDDHHEQVATWSNVCSVRASVVPQRNSEQITADRPEVQQVMNITCRYRRGLTVQNRIKHVQNGSTRYYEILSITDRGFRNRALDITAVWRSDNG